jgi:hypothetical protein
MSTEPADEVGPEDLLDNVREAPRLEPAEKETLFRFAKPDTDAVIDTTESGLTRRLLAHPAVDVDAVTVLQDGGGVVDVSVEAAADRDVVGLRGTVPVGALKVLLSERETEGHAEVVSGRVYRDGGGDE